MDLSLRRVPRLGVGCVAARRRSRDGEVSQLYRHTQIGWTIIVIVGAALVAEVIVAAVLASEDTVVLALSGAVAAVLAVVLAIFSTLTVTVDDTAVRLSFGFNVLRREVPLDEVAAVSRVRNSWVAGWGVRIIANGRLYNVGGLDAVELELDNGRVVRVGTDEPDELLAAVRRGPGSRAVTAPGAAGAAVATPAPVDLVPDPSRFEVVLTRVMLHGLMSGAYRSWVASLGLRGDEQVLDYGSGSGAAARHLVEVLEPRGGHLTCADVSPGWQAALRRSLAGHDVSYALGDIRRLALPGASFDVVVVHWMLHDVPAADRPAILAELARLLRPGGRLATREPTRPGEGIATEEVRALLAAAGLREQRGGEGSAFLMGPYYTGIWEKPPRQE